MIPTTVYALLAAVALPQSARGNDPASPTSMTGTALGDPSLKDGTVSVRVVGSSFRDSLDSVHVAMYGVESINPTAKGESKLTLRPGTKPLLDGRTGSGGRVYLNARDLAGREVVLFVTHNKMVQVSRSFRVPETGGLRLIFTFGMVQAAPGRTSKMPPDHPPTTMPAGVKGKPVVSVEYRIASVEAGKMAFMVVYIFWNRRKEPLRLAEKGVFIPHPRGLRDVAPAGHDPQAKVDQKGVTAFGLVPPGRREVAVNGRLRFNKDLLRVYHRIPVRLHSFGIISRRYKNIRFMGPDLEPATLSDDEADKRYRALRGPGGPPQTVIEYNVSGLPYRSKFWSKAAIGLAVLLLLAALARTLLARFKPNEPPGHNPASAATSD